MEKYEVLSKIGKGACGAVYLVRDKRDKRCVISLWVL